MVFPLIVAGLAATGLTGLFKGGLAASKFARANEIRETAKESFDGATLILRRQLEAANAELEGLDRVRVETSAQSLEQALRVIEIVHSVKRSTGYTDGSRLSSLPNPNLMEMKSTAFGALEVLKGSATALSAGAAGVAGTVGLVGMLGTASTGTAIGSLTGAAATNATMAWLGGGALSAGGYGMVGGAAVLGGVFAAPVILVAGFAAGAAATKSVTAAEAVAAEAAVAVGKMRVAGEYFQAVTSRAREMINSLTLTRVRVHRLCAKVSIAINQVPAAERSPDGTISFMSLTSKVQADYEMLTLATRALHSLIRVNIVDEAGVPSQAGENAISLAKSIQERQAI